MIAKIIRVVAICFAPVENFFFGKYMVAAPPFRGYASVGQRRTPPSGLLATVTAENNRDSR